MKRTSPQVAAVAIAIAAVVIGKHYYRHASADDLAWLLAPTAHLVSTVTGAQFVREAGVGWMNREIMFLIAPVCAGCQFLFAGFLVMAVAWVDQMRTWRAMANRLALAAICAYVATLAINTMRIAIAVWMHTARASSADLHRFEGIVVYFGGLCALYAAASSAQSSNRFRWVAVPTVIYLVITLGFPVMNGALARPGFARHAGSVALACGVIAGLALVLRSGTRLSTCRALSRPRPTNGSPQGTPQSTYCI